MFAMNSLLRFSACSRESAILLKESIRAPISSVVSAVCFTRTEKSPLANFREAEAISSKGLAILLEYTITISISGYILLHEVQKIRIARHSDLTEIRKINGRAI